MVGPWAFDPSAPGRRTAPLLVIHGGDGEALAKPGGAGFRFGGNSDVYQLIPPRLRFDQINMGRQFLKAEGRPNPRNYACVLNLVTDPDQHPRTLDRIGKLLRGYKGRLVNPPKAVRRTTRDQVAKRLAGIDGLIVPKIVRLRNPKPGAASLTAERAGQRFPIIVRRAGTHTGKILGVAGNPAELDAMAAGEGEFLLIEFVDFRSEDGLYRKYRFWSFGGRTIFRHMVISDDWNVHVKDRLRFMLDRPELVDEEMRLLEQTDGAFPPGVHATVDAVKERMGLDFFGLDCAIARDGQLILFEANATMNFFPLEPHLKFSYLGKIHGPASEAFMAMLGAGVRA